MTRHLCSGVDLSWHAVPRQPLNVRLVGSVKGHEQKVMQSVQQHLQRSDIAFSFGAKDSHEPAPVTILFHRVKARLLTDEIQYILSTVHGNDDILQHEHVHEQHVWYLRSLNV